MTAIMDEDLTEEVLDLPRLLEKYYDYRAKWRIIGCFLNISQGDLDAIETDYPKNCGDCFMVVIRLWLRKKNRQESELQQAVEKAILIHAQDHGELQQKKEKSKKTIIENMATSIIICVVIAILLATVVLIPPTPLHARTVSGPSNNTSYSLYNATIQTLKEFYKKQPVMECTVVDDVTVPFLNVSLRRNHSSVIEFWQLFHDIDTEYKNLQESSSRKGKNANMRILITGHPGGGKTTLLRYLANQWGEGNVLESCQIVFLIQLDQLSQSMEKSPQSLKKLLLNYYEDYSNIEQLSEEIVYKQGAGICFLLDSYDGWKFNHDKDFVHKLFFEGILHYSLCILTTRSLPFKESEQSSSHNYMLMGFNQTRLDEYLYNLTTDRHTISFIQKSWKDHNTKELCAIPLNMMMLIYIAKYREKPLIHRRTQLYIAFMNVTTNHYSERHRHPNWNSYELKQCILHREFNVHKHELCAAFHNLTYVAFEAVFYNKVPEISTTTRCNIEKLSLVRLVKVKSTYDRVKYIFSHDTFAEFYAAIYLLNLPPEHLLYLFVKGQNDFITLKTQSAWGFFFGLLGEHYSAGMSISAVLRQFSLFGTTEPTCTYPPVEVIQLIPEIGWTGEILNYLLKSAGLIQNYTICIENKSIDIKSLASSIKFILNHATVHTLKILQGSKIMMIFNKGKRRTLEFQTIERAIVCPFDTNNETIKPLSSPSLTHFHQVDDGRSMFQILARIHDLHVQCLMKLHAGVNNLHSLHFNLRDMSSLSQQITFALIVNHTPHLQTLRLITDNDLPSVISNLNLLRSTVKLELVIHLNTSENRPKSSLLPLEKLKNLSRLESLTIIIDVSTKMDKGSSLEPHNTVILGKLTGLKHLSVQASYVDDFCSTIVDQLGSLKSKVIETLEIGGCHIQFGGYVMKRLNQSKLLPPTLQHISLTRGELTDEDMPLLVKSLKEIHNLSSLSLHSNRITGIGLRFLVDGLKSLKNFTTLDLSRNPITVNNGLDMLVNLTNLRDLKLRECDITAEAFEVLSNLNLNSFDLSLNPVLNSVDGLKLLGRFNSIRYLDIRGTRSFHGEILMNVLKNLTNLQILKLCDKFDYDNTMYSEWSTDLARKVIDLPELQSIRARCLYAPLSYFSTIYDTFKEWLLDGSLENFIIQTLQFIMNIFL